MTAKTTRTRANIPGWLANPEGVAPCLCGRPLGAGELPVIATGELGMRRWFHLACWNMMPDNEDYWDDEDDEE